MMPARDDPEPFRRRSEPLMDGHHPLPAVAVSAFAIALVATPLARWLALDRGWVDRPAARKGHKRPTPLLGGVALVAALLPGVPWGRSEPGGWALAAAFAVLFAAGLWDDRRGLGMVAKLLLQGGVAVMLVAAGYRLALPLAPELTAVASLAWIVGVTNALNLLDNMDGLAASIAGVAALGFLLLLPPSSPASLLAAAVLGGSLGFLPYNAPPARIFMGDAGSQPLGLALAVLGLELTHSQAPRGWLLALLVLAVPLADTTTVCVSRLRRGYNPLTTPGTDHLSHCLRARGAGDAGAVLLLVLAAVAGSVLAWLMRAG